MSRADKQNNNAPRRQTMKSMKSLAVCGCVLALMAGCAKGPAAAYKELTTKVEKQDWAGVYDSFSAKSQGQMDMAMEMVAGMSATFAEGEDAKAAQKLTELKGKELFVAVMSMGDDSVTPLALGEVTKEDIQNDMATLTVKTKKGKEESVKMVKENKQWKLVPDMD